MLICFKEAKSQSMLSAQIIFTSSAPVLLIFLNSDILQYLCKEISFSGMLKNLVFLFLI